MEFETTEEQRLLLETVNKFMDRRLPPAEVRRRDEAQEPPYDLLPLMGEIGILGLVVPERYGGSGMDWTTLALVQERLGQKAYMAASIFNRVVGFGIMSLLTYGSEAQKEEMLPQLVAGRLLIALALSEPEAGSDAAALRTRAVQAEGGWRISGRKTWISDAGGANYLLTPVRTDPNSKGSAGISLFLIPPATPGIAMTTLPKVGNHCMPSFDIGFDEVFVPHTAMIGQQGRGFAHMMPTLHFSRASMAATVTGCAQAAVDCAIAYARERRQFGRSISSFQVISHRLVDMQMRVDAARLMVRYLAWLLSTKRPCRREAAQAKVMATECLQFVTDHGIQIMASAGYSTDSDMQRFWRDGRLYSFGEGTNEIQRNIIARELGLLKPFPDM